MKQPYGKQKDENFYDYPECNQQMAENQMPNSQDLHMKYKPILKILNLEINPQRKRQYKSKRPKL